MLIVVNTYMLILVNTYMLIVVNTYMLIVVKENVQNSLIYNVKYKLSEGENNYLN